MKRLLYLYYVLLFYIRLYSVLFYAFVLILFFSMYSFFSIHFVFRRADISALTDNFGIPGH